MRRNPTLWFALSLLLCASAAYFWHLGNQRRAAQPPVSTPVGATNTNAAVGTAPGQIPLVTQIPPAPAAPESALAGGPIVGIDSRYPWQVRNTRKLISELTRTETAVLLQNAFVDTAEREAVRVAPHLRSLPDDGNYIVQARGPISDRFRKQLQSVGAEIVSYIPNNAYLVRMVPGSGGLLASLADAAAVLPFEPQYKLGGQKLLELALKRQPLPEGTKLGIVGFPGARDAVLEVFNNLGAAVVEESRSPFGPLFIIVPPADALVALANSPSVQGVEIRREKKPANDLSRVRLSVATNSDPATVNWLGLVGAISNAFGNSLWINLNDTGVDTNHPDLTPRVVSDTFDFVGHGTHVAGTIISSGLNSPANPNPNFPGGNGTNNFIRGSATNVSFRGIAPAASLYALNYAFADTYLQTNAAMQNYGTLARTNPMVSNNSWSYTFVTEYDTAAASYDAAVRDALPEQFGAQSMIYVFAAGNFGIADNDGIGLAPGTIESPATAKNVISVGALENPRRLTNALVSSNIVFTCTNFVLVSNVYVTNFPGFGTNLVTNVFLTCGGGSSSNVIITNFNFYLPDTDSSNQVADFSSRGNVDPGLEGLNGRFKPDVVAPGVFTVSTRSSAFSRFSTGFGLGALLNEIDLLLTNSPPYYRFDSGTSMSAPAVSGMLGLFQQFFEVNLSNGYSPALIKALLINGARSVSQFNPSYNFAINSPINDQGWGLPNLTNSIPPDLGSTSSGVRFFDVGVTNALATGDSHVYTLQVSDLGTNALPVRNYPIRITLVWTDPPGNPNAAVKLVNDLDLVVTNLGNSNVYYGNNFGAGVFTTPTQPPGTNPVAVVKDRVNNVENIYLEGPLDTNYVILVRGARVNVNARTDHTNNVVQDYALVISSDYPVPASSPFTLSALTVQPPEVRPVVSLNNALPIFAQRVGANTPLIGGPEGIRNQWDFYVFTNTAAPAGAFYTNSGTNVAFVTFLPPNLSPGTHAAASTLPRVTARNVSADLDLYLSTDPNLTNLLPGTLAAALKSTNRGGDELIIVPNANVGDVYYIGVKSEDYRAAEYALIGLSSDIPFATRTSNGAVLYGIPVPVPILDGEPTVPSMTNIFAINPFDFDIRRVVVTNDVEHELFGDLYADLYHSDSTDPNGGRYAVLYSHNLFDGLYAGRTNLTFDDSGRNDITNSIRTDTSTDTTLDNFVGDRAYGTWRYTVADNALFHTGMVHKFDMFIEERRTNDTNVLITLCGGDTLLDFVVVPQNATNMIISLINLTGGQVDMYVRRDLPGTPAIEFPTPTAFDKRAVINPPGGSLTLGLSDVPPLQPGVYYVLISNRNPVCVTFNGPIYQIDVDNSPGARFSVVATNLPLTLLDDVVSVTSNRVTFDEEIFSVEVGVRLDHPRVSDVALTLISPQGSRALLFENRGLADTNGLGTGYPITNVIPVTSSGTRFPQVTVIPAGVNAGTIKINYQFFPIPDQMTVYYDGVNIFDTGFISGPGQFNVDFGPGISTNVTIIMNEFTNPAAGTAWNFTATIVSGMGSLVFTEDTNKTTTPIKFLTPPFGSLGTGCPSNPIALIEGFEGVTPGLYTNGFMGGWSVDRSGVEVLATGTFGSTAHAGSNYLHINQATPGLISTNLTLTVGQVYGFTYSYARNPDSIALTNVPPAAVIRLGGVVLTNVIDPQTNSWTNLGWITTSLVFTATAPTMLLELDSTNSTTAGVLFDTLSIVTPCSAVTNVYVLPEESLDKFKGESTLGVWRLEIWDTRVGAAITNGLVSWDLRFTFASRATPVNAVALANCVTNAFTIGPRSTNYFYIDTPGNASGATNTLINLTGGPLLLFADRSGVPAGSAPPDDYGPVSTGPAVGTANITMFTNGAPPLLPGQRYFLAVLNPTTSNANFTLNACIGADLTVGSNSISPPSTPVPVIIPVGPASLTWVASASGIDHYRFNAASNAAAMLFGFSGLPGDAALLVRRDTGGSLPLPSKSPLSETPALEPQAGDKVMVVNTNAFYAAAVTPGLWTFSLFHQGTSVPPSQITLVQVLAPTNEPAILSNAVPVNFTVPGGLGAPWLYRFTVPVSNSTALFEVYGASGNVDLLLSPGGFPAEPLRFSALIGSAPEQVVLLTNAAGDYSVVVANHQTNDVNFTLRAVVNQTNGMLLSAQALIAAPDRFLSVTSAVPLLWNSIAGQRYVIEVSSNLASWTPYVTNVATNAIGRFLDPAPAAAQTNRYYRVRQVAP